MKNSAFPIPGQWPRTSVYLVGNSITADSEPFHFSTYNPLECEPSDPRPTKKLDQEHSSPAIALARLDLSDADKTLGFVKEWGLLGLWNIPRYMNDREINFQLGQFKEPFRAFNRAANEYQEFISSIITDQFNSEANQYKPSDMSIISSRSNELIKDISPQLIFDSTKNHLGTQWIYTSLLSTIYFKVFQLIQSNGQFKKCRWTKCNKPFYCRNLNNQYCSDQCKSSQTTRNNKIKTWKFNLTKVFPNLESSFVENQIDKLMDQNHSGQKTLEKELKKLIEGGIING